MAKVEFDIDTRLAPDQVMDALLDFSDRRPEIWPDVAPEYYEVRSVGDGTAEVKEGTIMPGVKIWAVEHYEWKRPSRPSGMGTVEWRAIESNFCAPGSGMRVEISPGADGGSHIHARWQRTATTFMGRILIGAIVLTRGGIISGGMKKNLDRLAVE